MKYRYSTSHISLSIGVLQYNIIICHRFRDITIFEVDMTACDLEVLQYQHSS